MWRWMLIAVLLMTACGEEKKGGLVSPPESPAVFLSGDDGEVIARVNGWAITVDDLRLVHPAYKGATPAQSLQVLMDRYLVVQDGVRRQQKARFDVILRWRQALAQTWIKWRFEVAFGPDSVKNELWEKVYWSALPKFDHQDTFWVADAQIICCGDRAYRCNEQQVAACQDEHIDLAQALHDYLIEKKINTEKGFQEAVRQFNSRYGGEFNLKTYPFQYDFDVPHDKQHGYTVVNENVARGARDAGLGGISKPVRSGNGLHVLFVKKFLPEVHRKFGDPDVMAQLKRDYFPMLQKKEVSDVMNQLVARGRIGIVRDALGLANWKKVTGFGQ